MLIKLPRKITFPNNIFVACSGGADSMALLHFLKDGGRKNVTVCHFNHGTPSAPIYEAFVSNYCVTNNIPLVIGRLNKDIPAGESKEFFWANERYNFFHSLNGVVVTGANLDDAVEYWLMNCLRGEPKIPSWTNGNVKKPFLLTEKGNIYHYCYQKKVPYVEDLSNRDTSYMRNAVRHKLIKPALEIQPGLYTTISRMLEESWKLEG